MIVRSLATLLLLACALAPRAGELPRGSREIEVALPISTSGHRDQLFRRYAFIAYQRGDRDIARRHFEAAARHPSLRGHLTVTDVQRCRWQTVADACTSYDFFDRPAFDPERYWLAQDRPWMHPDGVVDVGPLRRSRILPD